MGRKENAQGEREREREREREGGGGKVRYFVGYSEKSKQSVTRICIQRRILKYQQLEIKIMTH